MRETGGRIIKEHVLKDIWAKPKGGRIESGRGGWLGWGEWWGENGDTYI